MCCMGADSRVHGPGLRGMREKCEQFGSSVCKCTRSVREDTGTPGTAGGHRELCKCSDSESRLRDVVGAVQTK